MPRIMFQDVVCPRGRSNRKWYSVPLSFFVHTFLLATLIAVPLIATNDALPTPRAMMQFVTPYVPVVPAAPPPMRRAAPPQTVQQTIGAPMVAPDTIGTESGVIFQPGDVDTAGIGSIEGIVDVGQIAVDAPPPAPVAPPRVVVGGNIKAPTRTRYVMPEYPDIARRNRVQGVVVIEAVIGSDGKVEDTRILRSNSLLDDAALTAVRAWEYTPTLLNGRPTAVIMTVTVRFALQ